MPLTFTGKIYIIFFVVKPLQHVRLAQLDRAFGYGPKGRGFESSSARLKKKEILLTQHLLFLCMGLQGGFRNVNIEKNYR